ncbi:MAG: hypothetical protein D6759_00085 [Chloroflexi bacterium]|nr:MAG: hypothetical protein D6759_00085 [Chloroflexota bacterium]
MVRRETQNPSYWQRFRVTDDDLEQLTNFFLEEERPATLDELALALVRYRCQREEAAIRRKLTQGTLFQPKDRYDVGDTLVFPALDYAVGQVVGVRPGFNPEYGRFRVIQVQLEGESRVREFASEFPAPHRLNQENGEEVEQDALLTPEDLYGLYGDYVRQALADYLEQDEGFVRLGDQWFLKSLLVEIHIGHLNIAEAVLDINGGGPLPPEELLKELDLPEGIKDELKVFSLNYALQQDERFDEVGPTGQVLWFLRRLEPPEVLYPPRRLQVTSVSYDPNVLDAALIRLIQELEDEQETLTLPFQEEREEVTITLTFPHRRVGSLPLTDHLAQFFPTGKTERIRFLFRDTLTGKEWPGWVVREGRYVFGLADWYAEHGLPVGAYIDIRRAEEPGVVLISFRQRRAKREWIRVAVPVEGRLTFEMQKRTLACEYDDLMIVGVQDLTAIDEIWMKAEEAQKPVGEILWEVFPELAKLTPQGTVHAKTLYSAVNVVRRLPPGPIFAELVENPHYIPVGDNYWLFGEGEV